MRRIIFLVLLGLVCYCTTKNPTEPDELIYQLPWQPVLRVNETAFSDLDLLYDYYCRPAEWDSAFTHYRESFTPALQDSLVYNILSQAVSLGFDIDELSRCLKGAVASMDTDDHLLCLAERMNYDNRDGWTFTFLCGPPDSLLGLGHTRSLVVDLSGGLVMNIHDYLPLRAVVRTSTQNYDSLGVGQNFVKPDMWYQFRDRYNTHETLELRALLIEDIKAQVLALGEDLDAFVAVLNALELMESWPLLPCLLEKAQFYGEDVWIVSMIWGVWLPFAGDLGHYAMGVVSLESFEVLAHGSCL